MNIGTHYLIYIDFPNLGEMVNDPIANFTDAAWAYSDLRSKGREATVFQVEPPTNGQAGIMLDVTEQAENKLRRMLSYDKWGDWLDPRAPEEIAREAQIEARTASMIRKQMEAAQ